MIGGSGFLLGLFGRFPPILDRSLPHKGSNCIHHLRELARPLLTWLQFISGGFDDLVDVARLHLEDSLEVLDDFVIRTSEGYIPCQREHFAPQLISIYREPGVEDISAAQFDCHLHPSNVQKVGTMGSADPQALVVGVEPFTLLRGYRKFSKVPGQSCSGQLFSPILPLVVGCYLTIGANACQDSHLVPATVSVHVVEQVNMFPSSI